MSFSSLNSTPAGLRTWEKSSLFPDGGLFCKDRELGKFLAIRLVLPTFPTLNHYKRRV